MKKDRPISEQQCISMLMRGLKITESEAMHLLEEAVRSGKITPIDLTENERPHWKCWRSLN